MLADLYGSVVIISSDEESEPASDPDDFQTPEPISVRRQHVKRSTSQIPRPKTRGSVKQSSNPLQSDNHDSPGHRPKRRSLRSTSPQKRQKPGNDSESLSRTSKPTTSRGKSSTPVLSSVRESARAQSIDGESSAAKSERSTSVQKKSLPLPSNSTHRRANYRIINNSESELEEDDALIVNPASNEKSQSPPVSEEHHQPSPEPTSVRPITKTRASKPAEVAPLPPLVDRGSADSLSKNPPNMQERPLPSSPDHTDVPARRREPRINVNDDITEISHNDYEEQPVNDRSVRMVEQNSSSAVSRRRIDAGTMATRTRGIGKKLLVNEKTGEVIRVFITYKTPNRLELATLVKKYSDKDLLSKPRQDSLNLTDPDYVSKLSILPVLNDFTQVPIHAFQRLS